MEYIEIKMAKTVVGCHVLLRSHPRENLTRWTTGRVPVCLYRDPLAGSKSIRNLFQSFCRWDFLVERRRRRRRFVLFLRIYKCITLDRNRIVWGILVAVRLDPRPIDEFSQTDGRGFDFFGRWLLDFLIDPNDGIFSCCC